MIRSHVMICGGSGCTASGSKALQETMEKELVAKGLQDEVKIVQTGCFGLCELGPIMVIYPGDVFYSRVTVDDIPEIVEETTRASTRSRRESRSRTAASSTRRASMNIWRWTVMSPCRKSCRR